MTSGDWVAVAGIIVTILIAAVAGLLKSISNLKIKIEAKDVIIKNKDDTIAELKRQLDKLEITGTLMHRFFSQLPKANEISREIQP